jgi:hypothetical protein
MSENTHTAGDVHAMTVVGLMLGMFVGFLAALFVINHNASYHEAEYRKQMVELGVGSYDPKTGAFQTKACPIQ